MTDAIKPPSEVVRIIEEHIDANTFERNEDGSVVVDRAGIILTMSEDERISLTANAPVGEPVAWLEPAELERLRKAKVPGLYRVCPTNMVVGGTALYTHLPVAVGADEIMRALCHSCGLDLDQERRMADHGHTPSQHFLDEWQRYTTAILALVASCLPPKSEVTGG